MSDWCCEWFQSMIESYGEKGFSIKALNDESCDFRSFYLAAIPFDQEIRNAFGDDSIQWPIIKDSQGDIIPLAAAVELRVPLDYCLRCGANLKKLIKKNINLFDELAAS